MIDDLFLLTPILTILLISDVYVEINNKFISTFPSKLYFRAEF